MSYLQHLLLVKEGEIPDLGIVDKTTTEILETHTEPYPYPEYRIISLYQEEY